MAPGDARRHAGSSCYGVVVAGWGLPAAWSCRSMSCDVAELSLEQDHACTLTLPFSESWAVVPTRSLPFGPAAFVTFSEIVPASTVPLRFSGWHFALVLWSPDFPGEVDVDVDLFGPLPGGGAATANDAA